MKTAVVLLMMLGLVAAGAIFGKQRIRRRRRILRLESAELEVAAALHDGRLAPQTGESLLQHLEGLRRECSAGNEG